MTSGLLPVCRPLLPTQADIAPYIAEIDATRWYSNYGPLYDRFAARLGEQRGLSTGQVALVGNATIGLTLSLRASGASDGYCMLPAWTFPASPMAAAAAGLTPWFVDIDPDTWALTPEIAERSLAGTPGRVAAVMPVAPFGAPLPTAAWDDFTSRTGIPAVIDAAAAFDSLTVGRTPSVISLHATKALGIGEGGAIFSTDAHHIEAIQGLANFGLRGSRLASVVGMNGKLSEYACAVGLAAIDQWPTRRQQYIERAERYRAALSGDVQFQPDFGSFASATCVVSSAATDADSLQRAMSAAGIETLRWWPAACPDHPAFRHAETTDIPAARRAAAHTLGLPMSVTLSLDDIDRVANAVKRHLRRNVPN
ncbi:MAG: DegT/DnrJ/EryC1/StrS family aminotransferase [Thalassobaculum sp.]|uniref:DegT/DnrJ/EryC1/StrS family aminotransferase n=1 Tax=Thalassobaculum sp. TaxID=2022740 RepID=UPI0032ECA7A6